MTILRHKSDDKATQNWRYNDKTKRKKRQDQRRKLRKIVRRTKIPIKRKTEVKYKTGLNKATDYFLKVFLTTAKQKAGIV